MAICLRLKARTHLPPIRHVMSSYQKFAPSLPRDNDVRSDVHTIDPTKISRTQKSPQPRVADDTYAHLRKAAPANVPLRRTLEWVESLPPPLRPHALVIHFPRIANQIAAAWSDLDYFDTYMDSLLTDKRRGRKGFPLEVVAELAALERYRHTIGDSASPWVDIRKRG